MLFRLTKRRPLLLMPTIAITVGQSEFVGKLGDDEFGHMLASILKENSISTDGVLFDTGACTALAYITLRFDDECKYMFYRNPDANMLLKDSELNLECSTALSIHPSACYECGQGCRCIAVLRSQLEAAAVAVNRGAHEQIMSIWEKADIVKVSDTVIHKQLAVSTSANKIEVFLSGKCKRYVAMELLAKFEKMVEIESVVVNDSL
ncbi:hypothetical protein ACLOJK_008595 [Asimina triloba]